jgi:hypothetical protein
MKKNEGECNAITTNAENIKDIGVKNSYIMQTMSSNEINDNSEKIIIKKISDLLSDICDENTKDLISEKNLHLKPFLMRNIPPISIKDYLERLCKHSKINTSTIILILIYIDRICNIQKFKLTYYNVHKLILASMIIAIKYNEDEYYSNKFYSKLGGVSISEIVFLEYHFLSLIHYNLFVNNELFKKYNDYISSADSDEEEYDNDKDNDNSNNDENNNRINNNNNNNQIINDKNRINKKNSSNKD